MAFVIFGEGENRVWIVLTVDFCVLKIKEVLQYREKTKVLWGDPEQNGGFWKPKMGVEQPDDPTNHEGQALGKRKAAWRSQ